MSDFVEFIGWCVLLAGGTGILCGVTYWATEWVLKLFGLNRLILGWYADRLRQKRDGLRP